MKKKTFPFSLGRRKEVFLRRLHTKKLWAVLVRLSSEGGDGAQKKGFPLSCPTSDAEKSTWACVCSRKFTKELNCVYKSDNCWETKSFMVEFLLLFIFLLAFFAFFSSFSVNLDNFFSMWFSHRIFCNRIREAMRSNFLFSCDMMVGKRREASDGYSE